MYIPVNPTVSLPAYHEAMLLVKFRSSAAPIIATAAASLRSSGPRDLSGLLTSPGLSALSGLERIGMIKRVTSISTPTRTIQPRGLGSVLTNLATTPADVPVAAPTAGVSLVEVQRDSDISVLQTAFLHDPHVDYAVRVPIRYLQSSPVVSEPAGDVLIPAAVPPPANTMWNLQKIRWADARALPNFKQATAIKVGVLDTGVDVDHPDLQGRVSDYSYAYPDLPFTTTPTDEVGHGTHVCGIISAIGQLANNVGINGVCLCKLHVHKIFSEETMYFQQFGIHLYVADPTMYLRSLQNLVGQGVQVVNLSLGGSSPPSPPESDAYAALLQQGVVLVAAMGNFNITEISYPAAIDGVIAVGATNIDDTRADFSKIGSHICLSAPGMAIWSTMPTYPGQTGFYNIPDANGNPTKGAPIARETDYAADQGTSMAAPHVTGAVALLLAAKGQLTQSDVRVKLMTSADHTAAMGNQATDINLGAGRLNLVRLLQT